MGRALPVAYAHFDSKEISMADDIATTPKKSSKLKWILLIFFIFIIGGSGAGAWYYFFSDLPGSKNAPASGSKTAPAATAKKKTEEALQTTVLDSFIVNLADPLGKRYINVTFEVEVTSPEVVQELAQQKPKIRDSIIMLLSSKSYADLMPPESKLALKTEVINRLNQILGGSKVSRVFFTHMVIQ